MSSIDIAIVGRAIIILEAIQKGSHEPIKRRKRLKMKQREYGQQLMLLQIKNQFTGALKSPILISQY